jgi:hypothetical protein
LLSDVSISGTVLSIIIQFLQTLYKPQNRRIYLISAFHSILPSKYLRPIAHKLPFTKHCCISAAGAEAQGYLQLINACISFILISFAIIFLMTTLRRYATSRKIAVSIPNEVITFFNRPNPSSSNVTQPLTEMSTRNLPGDTGQPARKADNITAICELIV